MYASSTLKSEFFRIFAAPLPVTNFADMFSKLFAIAMSLVTWPNPIGLEKKSKSTILVQNSDQISRLSLSQSLNGFHQGMFLGSWSRSVMTSPLHGENPGFKSLWAHTIC